MLTEDQIGTDDNTLLNLLRQIANRVARGRRVANPANSYEDLNRLTDPQWTAFCNGLHEFIDIAASACAVDNEIEAADLWSQAFAHFFPMPDISTGLVTDSVSKSTSLVPIAVPDVNVRAVGQKNANVKFDARNGIGPIPKDCDITLEIADPSKLRPGTSIDWIVRNEGAEAEMVNDLGIALEVASPPVGIPRTQVPITWTDAQRQPRASRVAVCVAHNHQRRLPSRFP